MTASGKSFFITERHTTPLTKRTPRAGEEILFLETGTTPLKEKICGVGMKEDRRLSPRLAWTCSLKWGDSWQ
jgi:hypothetical protein